MTRTVVGAPQSESGVACRQQSTRWTPLDPRGFGVFRKSTVSRFISMRYTTRREAVCKESETRERHWHSPCFTDFHETTNHTTDDEKTTITMTTLINKLLRDEAGFIVSAELVLISTITVLGLVVGLSEVSLNINNELEDVGSAFSAMNQGFSASGMSGHKGDKSCSSFDDGCDFCAGQDDVH